MPIRRPIVIAHRGASGYAPEHTLAAYFLAIEQGADFIEPDLVMSRDGVLVARHENEIGGTTDVAAHPRFAPRCVTKTIDGNAVTGWFTEDFTLAELKTLRARERLGQLRPCNARLDGCLEIPTFEEILTLARAADRRREARARALGLEPPPPIGVYPETKHPSYFTGRGLPMEAKLVEALERHGFRGRDGRAFLQSFEVGNLRALSAMTRLPLVQLIEAQGAPYDLAAGGDRRSYADLIGARGLEEIAGYAAAIGPAKALVIAPGPTGELARPTPLVARCHAQGLEVHPWTFRAENAFLPPSLARGRAAADRGDLESELRAFLAAGIDGFFTDQPDIGVRARDAYVEAVRSGQ